MQIAKNPVTRTCDEAEIYNGIYDFSRLRIIELGCGAAGATRHIAQTNPGCSIDALEVDEIQHGKNLQIADLPNVRFVLAGAQDIPAADQQYDAVFMFKSLHHVPRELLPKALEEIHRVLVPGGRAYISEPVYAGDFNELISLYHDEKVVREHAFAALQEAVNNGLFQLEDEIFFNVTMEYEGFAQFYDQMIGNTYSDHHLSEAILDRVKAKFAQKMGSVKAGFTAPIRVDLLRKPG